MENVDSLRAKSVGGGRCTVVHESFSVGLPVVTLEELQVVDAALRNAEAIFTYEIGVSEYTSFADLPFGDSPREIRIKAWSRDGETQMPLATLCVHGTGIDAALHDVSASHRLWFVTIRCDLLQRKSSLLEDACLAPLRQPEMGASERVWLVCRSDLVKRLTVNRTVKEVARVSETTARAEVALRTNWLTKILGRAPSVSPQSLPLIAGLESDVLTKLGPLVPYLLTIFAASHKA